MTFAVYREVTAELFCYRSHFKDLQGQILFRFKGSIVIYRELDVKHFIYLYILDV